MARRKATRSSAAARSAPTLDAPPPAATAILDTAEELFCARGFSGVSMREIASASGQHLASANYYFGSKAGLFEAVFLRRIVPVNRRRVELLEEYAAAGRRSLAEIVDAYLRPLFEDDEGEAGRSTRLIMLFSKQLLSNPDEHDYLQNYYDEVARAFITSIRRAMPSGSVTDAIWGYNYMVGVLVFTLAGTATTARVPTEILVDMKSNDDPTETIARLTTFLCAGLSALGCATAVL